MPAGRVLSINDASAAITTVANPPGATAISFTRDHVYNTLDQRTSVTWDNANAQTTPTYATVTLDHHYNKVNQRNYKAATDNSYWLYPTNAASTLSYTANTLNQYTAVGAVSPTYDTNGNLTSDGTFTFAYDSANRLITATATGITASYAYDSRGQRKSKTVNGATTYYISDANDREVLEYDGSTGQILRHYPYGNGIDEALNQVELSGDRQTLIPDIQGSTIASLGSVSGTLTKTGYRAFGQSASTTGSLRYTGRRIDAETNGLYYYRARMYSPEWGRFLQPDPIGYAGGQNMYAYVGNDPMNNVDPSGLLLENINGSAIAFANNARAVGQHASAFANGAGSVITGTGNFVRQVGRASGALGRTEQIRFRQEGKFAEAAIGVGLNYVKSRILKGEAHQLPGEFTNGAITTARAINRVQPLAKTYALGRAATGFILSPLGVAAFVGDTMTAVENGHNIVDSVIHGGILGQPHGQNIVP